MGKSIKSSWFGLPVGSGSGHITVSGVRFADGTTATDAYIVKQTGSAAYIVQDQAMIHAPEIVFMVNAAALSALLPGQCFILATPFGGAPGAVGGTGYTVGTTTTETAGVGNLGTITPGGSYLPNIYENVPLTGGTGHGATATININGAGSVGAVANNAAVVITNPGTGYTAGDVLSATTQTGVFSTTGLGSGFAVVVSTVVTGTFPTGPLATGALSWSGLNYLPGSYTNVPLVGGHGTGAQATIVVNGATNVSSVVVTAHGTGYKVGDVLSATPASLGVPVNNPGSGLQSGGFEYTVSTITPTTTSLTTANTNLGGSGSGFSVPIASVNGGGTILTLGAIVGGSGYINGTYTNVPLSGGAGSGAEATVIVAGGAVTSVTLTAAPAGTPMPCFKIAQFRVDIFNVINTVPTQVGGLPTVAGVTGVTSYSWSTMPANAYGEADLIT